MAVFAEKEKDGLFDKGILSFEERTLLIQLEGRSKDEVLSELDMILTHASSSDDHLEMQIELIDSLKTKILTHPGFNIETERSLYSPLY